MGRLTALSAGRGGGLIVEQGRGGFGLACRNRPSLRASRGSGVNRSLELRGPPKDHAMVMCPCISRTTGVPCPGNQIALIEEPQCHRSSRSRTGSLPGSPTSSARTRAEPWMAHRRGSPGSDRRPAVLPGPAWVIVRE